MILTIAGNPGSGKSTVAKRLAQTLNFQRYSVGDLLGQMALERGITINELMHAAETDPQIDKDADAFQTKLADHTDNFVIDSRLGFHFIPQSFKVFLKVDPAVGAQRIFNEPGGRPDEPKTATVALLQQQIAERVESEKKRYAGYYGLADYTDPKHFDLVVDTTRQTIEEVVKEILNTIPKR